jgi:hypothetical protein
MREYQASGKAPILGVVIGLLLSVLSGALVGWLLHTIINLLGGRSLIIVFPLVAGAIAGFGVMAGVKFGKIRNGIIAGVLGLVAATTANFAEHFMGYQNFLGVARQQIFEETGKSPTSLELQKFTDLFLMSETGKSGYWGYFDLEMKAGTSVGRGVSKGVNTGSIGAQILNFIEWLLMAGAAGVLAFSASKEPFDEHSDQWYGEAKRALSFASFDKEEVLEMLTRKHFEHLGHLGQRGDFETPDHVQIMVRNTPDKLAKDLILEVKLFEADEKGKVKETLLKTGFVTRAEFRALMLPTQPMAPGHGTQLLQNNMPSTATVMM